MPLSYPDLLAKKRDGQELTEEEVGQFVDGVVTRKMADCQIGAMLMAMCLKGLSPNEVSTLTREMMNSGETLKWPDEFSGKLVDKHSTGGVGDKVSLVLAPALAAIGLKVPMISGRGLAHTGGTLDKLEAIRGFNVSLKSEEMVAILRSVGCFIAGQTRNICPADKRTYEFRDVTSTVKDIGLITASIVSKKAAENINTLVLDVKTGSGAFMQEQAQAEELAKSMVSSGKSLGIKTSALLTDMDSPIGNMVGNALEVAESIECLQGRGPEDLLDLVVNLGGHLLHTGGYEDSIEAGCDKVRQKIVDRSALTKFLAMLKGQGVDPELADDLCNPDVDIWSKLTPSKNKSDIPCTKEGYVMRIDAMDIAMVTHRLGGGRNLPGEAINWAVGLQLLVDIGDKVKKDQPWVRVHHDEEIPEDVMAQLNQALVISSQEVEPRKSRLIQAIN